MKARVFFLLAAATVLLASCTKEKEMLNPSDSPAIQTKICVGIDNPDTKTYMGDLEGAKRKVYWSNGDKININGLESAALEGIAANSQTATFSFATDPSVPYKVLYPASDWTNATQITLPSTQVWKDGNFADGMVPMSGYSADGANIAVKYLCAVIKVPILQAATDADTDALACVRFRGRNNEQVKGLFGINYTTGVLSGASDDVADREVRVYQEVATSTTDAAVFYITVPAGTYSNGFDIIVQDAHNDCMTKSKTGSVTLEAGNIYNLAEFAFVPDGTVPEADLVINSAEELIAFATKFNNKEYDSYGDAMVVKLGSNITFNATTSASFVGEGGIGRKNGVMGATEDIYFRGIFDGDGHTISGLESTVPMFCATGSAGVVKDLTVESSCSFEFTHENKIEAMFGAIVGYHKGLLDGVTVKADISLAAVADVEYMTTLGGLVGRATTGHLNNCVYSGLITIPEGFTATVPDDDSNLRKLIIGGLVGRFTNAGSVTGSYFKGAISNAAQLGNENDDTESALLKRNPFTIIGGIVGHLAGGATVSDCHSTADHATVATAHTGATSVGHLVTKSALAYFTAVGGIVGENNKGTVSECTNAAEIFNTIFKQGDNDSRYIQSGGIVGRNDADGTISDCTNSAKVQHRSNPRIQALAGIAGYNDGTVKSCTNNGEVNHMTTGVSGITKKGGRVVNIAGIVGETGTNSKVSDVHNTANIQISAMEDGTASEVHMGGVIAYNLADIDGGSGKNITNTGQVYFNNNYTKQFLGYAIGGVVGYSKGSISNVKNSGYVIINWNSDANVASKIHLGGIVGLMAAEGSIVGCVNEGGASNAGEVYVNVKAGAAKHTDNYAGGIVGKSAYKLTISDCTNSGYVHGGNTTKQNGTTFYAGGIIAYLNAGESSISNCINSGNVYNNHSSNSTGNDNTAFNGGIAGWISGASEKVVTISECSHTTSNLGPRRGFSGGIVGYANYASLSNCTVGAIDFTGSAYFIGGIAGWAVNSTLANCSVASTSIVSSQAQRGGGIVAKLGEGSTLDGCSTHIASITGPDAAASGVTYFYGAVAGDSVAGSTIKNCHYPATGTITGGGTSHSWAICGDDNFTDGGGNEDDL